MKMWFILPFPSLIYFTSVAPDNLSQSFKQGTGDEGGGSSCVEYLVIGGGGGK